MKILDLKRCFAYKRKIVVYTSKSKKNSEFYAQKMINLFWGRTFFEPSNHK